MRISQQVADWLDQLILTGLFGSSRDEVIEELIRRQLDQMLQQKHWALAGQITAVGPRCPKCGSSRLNDISGMGERDVQCLDCDHRFKL